MLDLGNAQQGRDDGQRLVEACNRLIDDGPQLLECGRVLTPALQAHPHSRERRAQIMRDIVAHAGNLMDESSNVVQHPVHDESELVEWIIDSSGR
jgi:hypothetical protein